MILKRNFIKNSAAQKDENLIFDKLLLSFVYVIVWINYVHLYIWKLILFCSIYVNIFGLFIHTYTSTAILPFIKTQYVGILFGFPDWLIYLGILFPKAAYYIYQYYLHTCMYFISMYFDNMNYESYVCKP